MAIVRLSCTFYKVLLGLCLLLIVLLSVEIFFSFSDDDNPYEGNAKAVGLVQRKENSDGFQEGEAKLFDFLEVDENWTDRYSEGGLTSNCGCKLTEIHETGILCQFQSISAMHNLPPPPLPWIAATAVRWG